MIDVDDLIRRIERDDPRVCEALMLGYYDFIYNLANSFLCDGDEAADAAQETFLQAAQYIRQYQPGTSLKSWLAKIALNICRSKYRKRVARQRLQKVLAFFSFQSLASELSPEDTVILNEKKRALKNAVDCLDDRHRTPLLLRYVHGMTVPEIALALDVKEGTVYSRLHYAHQKLRAQMGVDLDLPDLGREEIK